MIILPDFKMVVVGPTKCATTTLHNELVLRPWNGFQLDPDDQHDFGIPEEYVDFRVVSPVRNPYERAMSLYWHYLRDVRRVRAIAAGAKHPKEWQKIKLPFEEIPLPRYMEMVLAGNLVHLDQWMHMFFLNSVSDWLTHVHRVDDIIHVENLSGEWNKLFDYRLGDTKFGFHNNPGRDPWETHKSEKAIDLINEWAAEDFTRFGYAYQTCPCQSGG